jgi:hypothetical protein
MAFEMGPAPKDPIDVRHFSLYIHFRSLILIYLLGFNLEKRKNYFN